MTESVRTLNSEDSSACWMITSCAPSTEGGREGGREREGRMEGRTEREEGRGRERRREVGTEVVSQPTYWYIPIVKI